MPDTQGLAFLLPSSLQLHQLSPPDLTSCTDSPGLYCPSQQTLGMLLEKVSRQRSNRLPLNSSASSLLLKGPIYRKNV